MNTRKILLAVTAGVALPVLAFAGGKFGGMGFEGRGFGHMGTIPTEVRTALTASGIAVPTDAQMKAHMETMRNAHEAIANLSDADKAALEKIREDAQKAERDFLRSKWVTLPSETEIATMRDVQKKIGESMKANGNGKNWNKGKRGGHNRGMHKMWSGATNTGNTAQ